LKKLTPASSDHLPDGGGKSNLLDHRGGFLTLCSEYPFLHTILVMCPRRCTLDAHSGTISHRSKSLFDFLEPRKGNVSTVVSDLDIVSPLDKLVRLQHGVCCFVFLLHPSGPGEIGCSVSGFVHPHGSVKPRDRIRAPNIRVDHIAQVFPRSFGRCPWDVYKCSSGFTHRTYNAYAFKLPDVLVGKIHPVANFQQLSYVVK
jgi:hypothetical protein